jgi:hypothetical protein
VERNTPSVDPKTGRVVLNSTIVYRLPKALISQKARVLQEHSGRYNRECVDQSIGFPVYQNLITEHTIAY